MPKAKEFLSVDCRDVPVSNLDKVLFPDGYVTKADVINYYLRVSDYLLPYGGGTVMVWDIGTYELLEGNYDKRYLHFHLNGAKLKGEWKLMRKRVEGERETWFLAKSGESVRKISKQRDDSSAISRRSREQIAESADAPWRS